MSNQEKELLNNINEKYNNDISLSTNKMMYVPVPPYLYDLMDINGLPPPQILSRNINGIEMTTQNCIDRYIVMIVNMCKYAKP